VKTIIAIRLKFNFAETSKHSKQNKLPHPLPGSKLQYLVFYGVIERFGGLKLLISISIYFVLNQVGLQSQKSKYK